MLGLIGPIFFEKENRVRSKEESLSLFRMAGLVGITNGVNLLDSLLNMHFFFFFNALMEVRIKQLTIWMVACLVI